ncbi:MAG: hypothetical protein K9I68_07200 [Bacteroidales bacterium]|nr:hypothetical protein [Bacteroidales bacterium]MCF8337990.1 hypothetical protein [Bacteroidales bacterium]
MKSPGTRLFSNGIIGLERVYQPRSSKTCHLSLTRKALAKSRQVPELPPRYLRRPVGWRQVEGL